MSAKSGEWLLVDVDFLAFSLSSAKAPPSLNNQSSNSKPLLFYISLISL